MKLKPPKAAAYWSWLPPVQGEVVALDVVGQVRDLVVARARVGTARQRRCTIATTSVDDEPEAGAGRRVGVGGEP